ncbi:hypothetical protein GCM10022631_37470 [Deinococcus rubellus]|uniref:hypothetical protein n=1 Tax=Deinococcus rubellus TaxID=1889240 RepID=UPI0031E57CE7
MPNYMQWNDALIEYFTYGAPVGSTIYLGVSDRTLDLIGQQFWGDAALEGWAADYEQAVRKALVNDGCVFPEMVRGANKQGRPHGVAFLGMLVLVATRMDDDAEQSISESDYLTRLNAALRTQPASAQVRRPRHMTNGAEGEEPLWQAWASYLRSRGYLPTAAGGKGAWKYIGYAVSQTLIREPEKRRLFQIFEQKGWGHEPDPDFLTQSLRREDVPAHVASLLRREGQGSEDVSHALAEAYREWEEHGLDEGQRQTWRTLSQHLQAGLYRSEHWRTGRVIYALFPRQPRGLRVMEVSAELPEGTERLELERPGYYAPLSELNPGDLDGGLSFPLTGHPHLSTLTLPARAVWLLRGDPDAPGAYASLGRPEVGEQVLLLIRAGLQANLETLRELGLVQWSGMHSLEGGWHEYTGLMVTANYWQDVPGTVPRELVDILRPGSGLSLSFGGGLRVPGAGAWLAAGPPQVSVNSFFSEVELKVCLDGQILFDEVVEPNGPISLPWNGPGEYELEAGARGQGQMRLLRLLDWADLPFLHPAALGQIGTQWQAGNQIRELVGGRVRVLTEAEI